MPFYDGTPYDPDLDYSVQTPSLCRDLKTSTPFIGGIWNPRPEARGTNLTTAERVVSHPFFQHLKSCVQRGIRIKAIRISLERFRQEAGHVLPGYSAEFFGTPITLEANLARK